MPKKRLRVKKGQVWVTDYTLSMLLFVAAALIAVKIIINSFTMNIAFDEMKSDASKISEMLLSEGFPEDWSDANVTRPGLLNNDSRLSFTKVSNSMNLSLIPYNDMRLKLQTKYDFAVIFRQPNGDMLEFNGLCVIGSPDVNIIMNWSDCLGPDFSGLGHDNLVKITRLAVYGSNITKMEVYLWN